MRWKFFIVAIFVLFSLLLLIFYWFIPFGELEFSFGPTNSNFSLNSSVGSEVQFYSSMRFPSSTISYRIENCPLQKDNDARRAFEILENMTVLNFEEVGGDGEILVTCQSKNKIEGDLFIAGEAGPTNVTQAGEFNVILNGAILLIRKSSCERPNIAIHEILHVLGFDHSTNSNNIMYPVSKCKQTVGQDTIDLINELYSIEPLSDLTFEDASAVMKGKYLDLNMSLRNEGLKASGPFEVVIYADNKLVKKIDFENLDIGYGTKISLRNIWVKQISVKKIELLINGFDELDKENNRAIFEIKK
jgi:hypothetical protein